MLSRRPRPSDAAQDRHRRPQRQPKAATGPIYRNRARTVASHGPHPLFQPQGRSASVDSGLGCGCGLNRPGARELCRWPVALRCQISSRTERRTVIGEALPFVPLRPSVSAWDPNGVRVSVVGVLDLCDHEWVQGWVHSDLDHGFDRNSPYRSACHRVPLLPIPADRRHWHAGGHVYAYRRDDLHRL